ncbi:putative trace amine-associated receptor 6-like [Triplophysa rosa]|uniref:Trace amine-associated receptor 6-like n=2 Tax=Triplophysa rosa TaxID=992332 RepID=A0A9W7TA77_TRIRA|nr:putative trace amine-associated receptor 6-like [Triplophysa rosa]
MENDSQGIRFCFPNNNLSCIREYRPETESVILYTFIFLASVFTVFLNLLVIISISHFKKLHTPTNLLILSLAAADMLVGLIVIPLMGIRYIETCWYFGETFCSLFLLISLIVVSASLGNLVFISVDRYIAVTDPLRYTVRVTTNKAVYFIIINWICSVLYSLSFYEALPQDGCHGDCAIYFTMKHVVMDLIVTLIAPCVVIMSLYVKIFCVAKHQARVVSTNACISRSQRKAAKTLGIVVVVYFLCWIPYYMVILIEGDESTVSVEFNVTCWVVYMNSCMNPLIYALFYRWFRLSAKHILTLQILQPSSQYFNLFPEGQ